MKKKQNKIKHKNSLLPSRLLFARRSQPIHLFLHSHFLFAPPLFTTTFIIHSSLYPHSQNLTPSILLKKKLHSHFYTTNFHSLFHSHTLFIIHSSTFCGFERLLFIWMDKTNGFLVQIPLLPQNGWCGKENKATFDILI